MSKWKKTLAGMRGNPQNDWSINDLETVASHVGIACRKPGGSHVTFSHPALDTILTVPAARPVKAYYVRQFVKLVDEVSEALP